MSPPVLIVFEQLNYTKPDGIHAIFMPVIIEFSRYIRTYSSAKFEFNNLYIECFEQIKSQHTQRYWDIVQCYFDFWEERKSLLLLFKQSHILSVLFDGAYKYSFGIFEYIRSKNVAEHLSLQLPYLLAYSVGGMHSMLLKWVENDMTVPSHILIEQLKNGYNSIEL